MTDFILLSDGTTKIATDEDGSNQHYQKFKIAHGTDGTFADTTTTNPFPVTWGQLGSARGAEGTITELVYGSSVVATTYEKLNELNSLVYLTTAATMRVKAGGNANDDVAGSGTRQVTIYGVSDTFSLVNEQIATAGVSASSATTQTYRRIYQIRDSENGTIRGTNAADITVEDGAGAADHITMPAGAAIGYTGLYTVPVAHKAYPVSLSAHIADKKKLSIRLMEAVGANITSAPFRAAIVLHEWIDVEDVAFSFDLGVFREIAGQTDIWLEAKTDTATASVTASIGLVVIPD